jgi:hypothetical protein
MTLATAYFDESQNGVATVVAGFAATAERWRSFDSAWAKLLDQYKISCLHMKDYVHSNGEFKPWKGNEEKRRRFMQRVIEIVSKKCMVSSGALIDHAAFSQTIAKDSLVSRFYVNEYSTASFLVLLGIDNWRRDCAFDRPVDYVFDRGNVRRSDFQRAYDIALSTGERKNFGALAFGDDQSIYGLQAADFIAYETCKVYTDTQSGQKRLRRSLQSLVGKMRCDIKIASRENLAKLVSTLRKLPAEELAQ